MGLIPVVIVVITAQRINASKIAATRIPIDRYQGMASRFTTWKIGSLFFCIVAASYFGHHHTDLIFIRFSGIHDVADLSAAKHQYLIGKL